jgi:phage protein U
MMSLDLFVFELQTLAYQDLSRSNEWRHVSIDRFGERPTAQFLGKGAEKISLSGTIYPGQVGDYGSLERLRELGDEGNAYQLMTGWYEILGHYIILKLDEKQSVHTQDGAPRKVDFTLELERFND